MLVGAVTGRPKLGIVGDMTGEENILYLIVIEIYRDSKTSI